VFEPLGVRLVKRLSLFRGWDSLKIRIVKRLGLL
jgi:hypothetical protein